MQKSVGKVHPEYLIWNFVYFARMRFFSAGTNLHDIFPCGFVISAASFPLRACKRELFAALLHLIPFLISCLKHFSILAFLSLILVSCVLSIGSVLLTGIAYESAKRRWCLVRFFLFLYWYSFLRASVWSSFVVYRISEWPESVCREKCKRWRFFPFGFIACLLQTGKAQADFKSSS